GGRLHIPGRGRAAPVAEAAVVADVFVLDHGPSGVRGRRRHVEGLVAVERRGREARPEVLLRAVLRHGQALDGADVDAGIALDAALRGEDGLDVAVQAALDFARRLLGREAELDLDVELPEA